MNIRTFAVLLLASLLAACAASPAAPGSVAPRLVQVTLPVKQTLLTGLVTDERGEPLTGARVEIVDGREAGLATTTDSAGSFSLKGSFDDATRVRASLQAFADIVESVGGWWPLFSTGARSISFTLSRLAVTLSPEMPVLQDGDEFTLTLAADSGCTGIPAEFRTRTYEGRIVGSPDWEPPTRWFAAVARTGEFLAGHDYFPIAVTGQTIRFLLNEDGFPYFSERVAPDTYMAFDGDAWASVPSRSSVIVAVAGGEANYCRLSSPPVGYWEASDRVCPGLAVEMGQCKFSQLTLALR